MPIYRHSFLTVGVAVGRAVKIESHENNRLPCPILVCRLREFDLSAGHVQSEVFALID
jgi:hypothetical protein